MFDKFL